MSDTPRTNKESFFPHDSKYQVCDADFCRQLERELNAANSRIELLMSANADVARIARERDEAENRIRILIAERDNYQDRIKRLESVENIHSDVLKAIDDWVKQHKSNGGRP